MAHWVDFKAVREHLNFHDMIALYGIDEHGSGDQIKIICPFHNDGIARLGEVGHLLHLYDQKFVRN